VAFFCVKTNFTNYQTRKADAHELNELEAGYRAYPRGLHECFSNLLLGPGDFVLNELHFVSELVEALGEVPRATFAGGHFGTDVVGELPDFANLDHR